MAETIYPKIYVNSVVPERFKFPRKTAELAQQTPAEDMLYAEAKKILDAKAKMEHLFVTAALYHIKVTTGRDLEKEQPHWCGHEVTVDTRLRGSVTVRQYLYDNRAPRVKNDEWKFTKRMLLDLYS